MSQLPYPSQAAKRNEGGGVAGLFAKQKEPVTESLQALLPKHNSMEDLFLEIEQALKTRLYFMALFICLTIPDICAALEDPEGESSGKKYSSWFDRYLSKRFCSAITGADCWNFRCKVLHQGTTIMPSEETYQRLLFIEPHLSKSSMHCCSAGNGVQTALTIDIQQFCLETIDSARIFIKQKEGTPIFDINYSKLIARHPNGLLPFVVGAPLIG